MRLGQGKGGEDGDFVCCFFPCTCTHLLLPTHVYIWPFVRPVCTHARKVSLCVCLCAQVILWHAYAREGASKDPNDRNGPASLQIVHGSSPTPNPCHTYKSLYSAQAVQGPLLWAKKKSIIALARSFVAGNRDIAHSSSSAAVAKDNGLRKHGIARCLQIE